MHRFETFAPSSSLGHILVQFGPSVFLINVISFSSVVCIGNYFGVVRMCPLSHSFLTGLLNPLLIPAAPLAQHPKTIPSP